MKNILLIGIMALLSSMAYSQVKIETPKVKVTKPKVLKQKKKKEPKSPKPSKSNRKRPGGTIKTKKLDELDFFFPMKREND